jgi:hypothetical protein
MPQVRVLLLDANLSLLGKTQVSSKDGRTWGTERRTPDLDLTFVILIP